MENFDYIHSIKLNPPEMIKTAGSQDDISHTIEELLELNNLIPARWGEAISEVAEIQLAKTPNRWEDDKITEKQLDDNGIDVPTHWGGDPGVKKIKGDKEADKDNKEMVGRELDTHTDDLGIIEVRLSDDDNDQRREEAWNTSEIDERGHTDIPPIWLEVYENQDEAKKLDKGQLKKKK